MRLQVTLQKHVFKGKFLIEGRQFLLHVSCDSRYSFWYTCTCILYSTLLCLSFTSLFIAHTVCETTQAPIRQEGTITGPSGSVLSDLDGNVDSCSLTLQDVPTDSWIRFSFGGLSDVLFALYQQQVLDMYSITCGSKPVNMNIRDGYIYCFTGNAASAGSGSMEETAGSYSEITIEMELSPRWLAKRLVINYIGKLWWYDHIRLSFFFIKITNMLQRLWEKSCSFVTLLNVHYVHCILCTLYTLISRWSLIVRIAWRIGLPHQEPELSLVVLWREGTVFSYNNIVQVVFQQAPVYVESNICVRSKDFYVYFPFLSFKRLPFQYFNL